MRAWISPLFLLALLLSLLLHAFISFGDIAWQLWENRDLDSSTPLLKASKKQLKNQSLATDVADADVLAGVQPVDSLTVRLGHAPKKSTKPAANLAKSSAPTDQLAATPTAEPTPAPTTATPTTAMAMAIEPTVPPMPTESHPPVDMATNAVEKPKPLPAAAATDENKGAADNSASKPSRPILDGPFPKSVDIIYMVKGLITADHRWRVKGKQYEIDTSASFAGKAFEMKSEGDIGPHGLKPRRFAEYRDRLPQPKYLVDFDWDKHTVRVGEPANPSDVPLEEGAQDIFSAAYQFALQGNKLPSFAMQVISGRKAYPVTFEMKGEAELTLSREKVNTLVLVGSYEKSRFEFYLAPEWHNLPVRIRRIDGDNTLDLVAVQLAIDNKVVLQRIERKTRDR